MKEKQFDDKDVVQSLVGKIPEEIPRQTMARNKKVTFREEAEHLGLVQQSGKWPTSVQGAEEEKLSEESDEWDKDSEKSSNEQDSLGMIMAEEKVRHRDRELQIDPSSGTYNLDQQRCAHVKNSRKLQYQRNRSGSYRAIQVSERTWCQMMTGRS